jgi:hypothetical protein
MLESLRGIASKRFTKNEFVHWRAVKLFPAVIFPMTFRETGL